MPPTALPMTAGLGVRMETPGGGGYGAFVLDTATGTTKVAYSSGSGPDGKRVNNLGKSFQQIK